MAWIGQPAPIDELVFNSVHGIVDQSLEARMGAEPTNGDGFGIGWYVPGKQPAVYRSISPAWADINLKELAGHVESPLFMMHVRAAIGSPIQLTNCHPFRHGDWLFVHNGFINEMGKMRRELMLALDPDYFPIVQGSTDSEVVFHLARTFGLEEDPIAALEQTVSVIESTARRHGIGSPVQGTFGISDGETLWAVRYASEGPARTLFASADGDSIKRLYPENSRFQRLAEGDRLVVSEPFNDLPGMWHEIPQGSAVVVRRGGGLEHRPFRPESVATLAAPSAGSD